MEKKEEIVSGRHSECEELKLESGRMMDFHISIQIQSWESNLSHSHLSHHLSSI